MLPKAAERPEVTDGVARDMTVLLVSVRFDFKLPESTCATASMLPAGRLRRDAAGRGYDGGLGRSDRRLPGGVCSPVLERRRADAALAGHGRDVGVVARAVEPLEHHCQVGAEPAHLLDRDVKELDRMLGRGGDELCRLRRRELVARDVEATSVQLAMLVERPCAVLANVLDSDHLEHRRRLHGEGELALLDRRQRRRAREVLHEEHRSQYDVRREPEVADRLLDPPLVLEVRDARLPMRRSHGRVDEVLNPRLAGDLRESLALLLLAFDADFPRVLHRVRPPRAGERPSYRRFIVEVTGDDLDAKLLHRPRRVRLRVARHAPHTHALRDQLARDRPALFAGDARDEYDILTRFHRFLLWV